MTNVAPNGEHDAEAKPVVVGARNPMDELEEHFAIFALSMDVKGARTMLDNMAAAAQTFGTQTWYRAAYGDGQRLYVALAYTDETGDINWNAGTVPAKGIIDHIGEPAARAELFAKLNRIEAGELVNTIVRLNQSSQSKEEAQEVKLGENSSKFL